MKLPEPIKNAFARLRRFVTGAPLLGWLAAVLLAVGLEHAVGYPLARGLGLPKVPALFGLTLMLKEPQLIPSALLYTTLIYFLPVVLFVRYTAGTANALSKKLLDSSLLVSALVHLALLYAVFHLWTGISDYRLVTLKLMLIAILLTLSLNLINGYMGEFSCSHPGFMALGAYMASVFTIGLFTDHRMLGEAVFSPVLGHALFPVGLFFGGLMAALGALIIAIPSFKTRGDYLAIISLAFLFIVKSLLENLEFMGGPRGARRVDHEQLRDLHPGQGPQRRARRRIRRRGHDRGHPLREDALLPLRRVLGRGGRRALCPRPALHLPR
jgi:branched-chain amino acid transport system permease protein